MPYNQTAAIFNKIIKKFQEYLRSLYESEIEATLPMKREIDEIEIDPAYKRVKIEFN